MTKLITILSKLFLGLLMLSIHTTKAQSSAPTINQKQEHVLKSTINGTTYNLWVSLPMRYSSKDTTRYPVLYILDGGMAFPIAHGARTSLDIYSSLEDVIIVSIEYEWKQSIKPMFTGRWKDMTPSKDAQSDVNPGILKAFDLKAGDLSSGGAAAYLKVIRREIIPFIDKKYKTTNDRGISGHSLGGLFAAYCLFNASDLFQRYGINSPSFWWNNKDMFTVEKTFSERHQTLPVRVFMSVGALEGKSMTPLMTAFADSLRSRNYKALILSSHVFEDETHTSVVPAMISRTLMVLYGKNKK